MVNRKPGEMQDQLLTSPQVAEKIGYRANSMGPAIAKGNFANIPQPDGRVGRLYYWLPHRVDEWLPRPLSPRARGRRF